MAYISLALDHVGNPNTLLYTLFIQSNLEFKKQKIAENISDSNNFWREVKRLKTTSKAIVNCIDEANGADEISNVFYEKYRMLYNSVPTDAHELDDLHNTISNDVVPTNNVFITPAIIKECLKKLKPGKGDGDRGFKSDHLIHSTHRFHVIIALLFNNMLVHGYTPEDLLKSSIISIPKDNTVSLTSSDNY